MTLTEDQIDSFNKEGCLIIKGYLDAETVKGLNDEIQRLYTEVDLKTHPMTKFTTEADGEHIGDKYFLESSDKIHFLFEPGSFNENGKLERPVDKAVNKIGHGLHFLNEKFRAITINDGIASICKQMGYKDPKALQSMVIVKQPRIGGEVPPHTDSQFLYTDPISCLGFWFALEDCTLENGCIGYFPGSHKKYDVKRRLVRESATGTGTKFVRLGDTYKDWTSTEEEKKEEEFFADRSHYNWAVIPAGSLVLIHGNVIHVSDANKSDKSRNAYVFHVVEGFAEYDELNWLQIPWDHPKGSKNFTRLYS
ncbi:hypothetical protein FOA43_004763 [Brettanomyces nanus]|uniref:Phytanoyl-CoA dioxygenase n=1 Tax=Eeniella nana TaxID=13502 RepID=A0A875S701_EENNA|nr:uncharacterized protein FOA43_004763 [Brettanomyces nanus]QPG77351.1 hypothetical protein FOA43_004763 [Brettanomyces nanus]